MVVGDRRYVARLLSYPTVCVRRDFLDATLAQLAAEPDCSVSGEAGGASAHAAPPPEELPTAEAAAAAAALGGMLQLSGCGLQESAGEAQPEHQYDSELEAAAELEQLGRLGGCQPAEGPASGAPHDQAASGGARDPAASPCVSAA